VYKDQSNLKEGADVVRYLAGMWKEPSPHSVGVVTFNRKQADIIEEFLEDWRGGRPSLPRRAHAGARGDLGRRGYGFFVKNVENVQGDERDVVVFSSTFGRNDQGAIRRNFGVLGQVGGERRLNVAVTRARKKVVLMT
jgi:primosomal replication protein N''